MTADELLVLPDGRMRHELLRGRLRVMPLAGAEHGAVAGAVFLRMGLHVEKNELGKTFAAETGFLIERNPDTVRAPDATFVSRERCEALGMTAGYWPGAPDFAAEVVCPRDTFSEVEEKALQWLGAGTKAVLVVDPVRRTATVYRSLGDVRHYQGADVIELDDAVPGWQPALAELFGGATSTADGLETGQSL